MRNKEVIYLSQGGIITADSVPDLDDWGVDDFWSCTQWVEWHKAMVKKYGNENANIRFAHFWNQQGFGAHALGCRTVDAGFRHYIQGIAGLQEIVWQGAGGLKYLLQPIGTVMQTGGAVGTAVAQGLQTSAKAGKYLIPALLTLATFGIIIYGYRTATKRRV